MALKDVMQERFVQSEFLKSVNEKLGGAICLHFDPSTGRGEFLWTHTTDSMGLAFQTTNCEQATGNMSRLPKDKINSKRTHGTTTILVESFPFCFNKPDLTVNDDSTPAEEIIASSAPPLSNNGEL